MSAFSPEVKSLSDKKRMNNKALTQFIKKLQAKVSDSESIAVVTECLDNAIAYPHQLKYRNTQLYLGILAAIIASIGYWFHLETQGQLYRYTHSDFVIFALCLLSLLVSIFTVFKRQKSLKDLSNLLRDEALKHLYNMTDCGATFLNNAEHKFVDFKRGNYSQNVEWGKEIDFNSELGLIRASVVYHHYVDRRTENYQESDGKGGSRTRTRTVYDHYYRQGVIFPAINNTSHLVMSKSKLPKHWQQHFMPASREFEKKFYLQTNSEFNAAKFLEPVVVVACEQLAHKLDDLTIEFAYDGSVLINQKNTHLLNPPMDYDISSPTKFKQELLNETSLFTVNRIFGFVNQIIKHSANPLY